MPLRNKRSAPESMETDDVAMETETPSTSDASNKRTKTEPNPCNNS